MFLIGSKSIARAFRAASVSLLAAGAAHAAGTPYSGSPIVLPGTIQAERYDKGGEGIAYHDLDAANIGGQFRTREGVDISPRPAATGYIISHFEAGEWVTYTVNISRAGAYDIEVLAGSGMDSTAFHFQLDGQPMTGRIAVPNAGNWETYNWLGKTRVTLPAGRHVLKVVSEQPYFGLDAIRVTSAPLPPAATPYSGTPATLPGVIEAEDFDRGGEGLAYHDTTPANTEGSYRGTEGVDIMASPATAGGHIVAHFEAGEWLGYTVNVASSGAYDIEVLAGSGMDNSAYRIEIDGQPVTGRIVVPNAGNWETYAWHGSTRINLAAGQHVLRVVSEQPYFGLDAIRVTAPSSARLLFRSGFEGGALGFQPLIDCWGTGCWQDLVGQDSLTSFTWPDNIGGGNGKFLMLSDPVTTTAATIGDYLFNRLETVTGSDGRATSALRQQISQNQNGTNPMGTAAIQNELQFLPKQEPGDMYVSYWMKLQPDLVEKMNNLPAGPGISGGGTWRAIFALKTGRQTAWGGPANDGDYRIEAYVMTSGGGQPYWVLVGDNNAGGGAPLVNDFWIENRSLPVPVGQWFKFEIFWHRSAGTDGRVWMAVNGQVVADRRGANMGAWNLPINRIMAPILYSGSRMPIYQWVDNLEVWDGFPNGGDNPPYAVH
jgi:hypothetical protein